MSIPESIPRVLVGLKQQKNHTETMCTTEVTELEVKINKHKNKNIFTCDIQKWLQQIVETMDIVGNRGTIVHLERLIVWLLSKSSNLDTMSVF